MTEGDLEELRTFFGCYFADEDGSWREPERVLYATFLYEHRSVFARAMDALETAQAGSEPLLPRFQEWTDLIFEKSETKCREWCERVLTAGRRFLREILPRVDEGDPEASTDRGQT